MTSIQAPQPKPSWDEAPEWAEALGIAAIDCAYQGEWCWLASSETAGFTDVECRPLEFSV